jgi:hypothetical protein
LAVACFHYLPLYVSPCILPPQIRNVVRFRVKRVDLGETLSYCTDFWVPLSSAMDDLGVILPPPDIRVIADKTAEFVSRNGVEFEARIIAANTGNPKFRFMNAEDPYRAYFDAKVREFREKRLSAAQDGEKKAEESSQQPESQPVPEPEAPKPAEQIQVCAPQTF